MRFNAIKCYKMSIHRSKDPYTHHYSLDNHILEQVENNPYLGVLISRDLKWSTHMQQSKFNTGIYSSEPKTLQQEI